MSEKMREDFEEWFYEYSLPCKGDWFKRDSRGDYDSPSTYYAWMGWQASRAALVVELPSFENGSIRGYSGDCDEANMVVDAIAESLSEAGVNYK